MPKIVDHEQRRHELTEALWRVVVRSGASAVSIRTVASEAGWSAGALRHYFRTRNELLEFAFEGAEQRVTQRIKERAQASPRGERLLERAAAMIEELLPLDEWRRAEFRIWQVVGEEIDQAHEQGNQRRWEAQRQLYRDVAVALCGEEAGDGHEAWARYLHTFCDGLAAQLMFAPAQMPPEEARDLLRRFLTAMARGTPDSGPA